MNNQLNALINVSVILYPTWIVTCEQHEPLLINHALVLQDNVILDILPAKQVAEKYLAVQSIKLPGQVIMPGLINLHSHSPMSLLRGYADDKPLMKWLNDYIWPAESKLLSSEFVHDASLLSCAEMLRGGITTFNDMYFYPKATAKAVVKSGIRANLGLVIIEFPSRYATDADDYFNKGFEAYDSWRDQSLITTSLAPHAPYTVSDLTLEKTLTYSNQLQLTIHTHLHETNDEIHESINKFGVRPIERFKKLGLLGPELVAAHAVHLNDNEREWFAQNGCHIAHCPASNAKLGSGTAEISKALKVGVNVGLGTDGVASNNRTDLFAEMRMAALIGKAITHNAESLNAHEVIRMGTINAAHALGLGDVVGSVAVGKQADLISVNVSDLDVAPCYDPIAHLVYACGREHVTNTWVAGELRYSDGCFSNVELEELTSIVARWQPEVTALKN